MKKANIQRLTLSALLLAIGMVLPFLTGQIPEIGNMLLPLHLPALVCGYLCGWPYGLAVGFILPLLRSLTFGMPPLVPTALAMAFEMAAYGAVAGLLYKRLPKSRLNVYVALIAALVCGRIAWGLVSIPLYALFTSNAFTLSAFWMGGFLRAWPGILLQLVLVPLIVFALERAGFLPLEGKVSHPAANEAA